MMRINKRYTFALFLLTVSLLPALAQTLQEKDALRRQRFSKLEYYHVGAGIEAGMNKNFVTGPKVYAGIGSYRNLFSADVGLKLLWMTTFKSSQEESVSQRQIPFFVSASANLLRWHNAAVFIGGELAYHLQLGATHQLADSKTSQSDNQLASNHASASIKLGTRINNWDFSLFCQRDFAPAYDQKYVYETADYDYDALHSTIFERIRFGVSVNYLFPF